MDKRAIEKFEKTRLMLDRAVDRYNQEGFIDDDPIQLPHRFTRKEDIEIIGFLVATLAWGNRKSIINSGNRLVEIMDGAPHDFIIHHEAKDVAQGLQFVHRTFNSEDLLYFFHRLQRLYRSEGGLERAFEQGLGSEWMALEGISGFKKTFFDEDHFQRTTKHVSDPKKNSAAKRLNMYLRWMVRKDSRGVDFGIWNSIPMGALSCPLDVHSGRVARKLQLLNRKQNDWKAVAELDQELRKFDSVDPSKYDFALFGLGVEGVV